MNFFKNKKAVIFSTAALTVALLAGGTYAWFTSSASASSVRYPVGNLEIAAAFDGDLYTDNGNGPTYYQLDSEGYLETINDDGSTTPFRNGLEPGMGKLYVDGSVSNIGSLQAVVKVDVDTDVLVKYTDNDKTPVAPTAEWGEWDSYANVEPDEDCPIESGVEFSDLWDGESPNLAVLFVHSTTKESYLLLDPSTSVNINAFFNFDDEYGTDGIAERIGNQFQNCRVMASGENIVATQTMSGAMLSEFGVDLYDEDWLAYFDMEIVNANARSVQNNDAIKAQILEHFGL